jgi:hypothetical protein
MTESHVETTPTGNPAMDNRLFEVFERVVSSMAFLPADLIPWSTRIEALTEEFIVDLEDSCSFTLLVRCDRAFPKLLAESASGGAATDEDAQDAFKELVNILCGNLMSEFWSPEKTHGQPFMPRPGHESPMVGGPSDASCTVGVGDCVVQVLYWDNSPKAAAVLGGGHV